MKHLSENDYQRAVNGLPVPGISSMNTHTKAKKQTAKPLYKMGDTVSMPANLYDETTGKIVKIGRLFKEINPVTGKFIAGGLVTDEDTIKSICIPYTFDGETLTVNYPGIDLGDYVRKPYTRVSKFYQHGYVVKSHKICTAIREKKIISVLN